MQLDVSAPSCFEFILRFTFAKVPGHRFLSCVDGEIGVFQNDSTRVPFEFQCESSLLRCDRKSGSVSRQSRGIDPHVEIRRCERAHIKLCWESGCSF